MTAIERTIRQLEAWLDAIDRERDGHAQTLALPSTSAITRAFINTRLELLDEDRAETLRVLDIQRGLQHTPALMFAARPVMARATTTSSRGRRTA